MLGMRRPIPLLIGPRRPVGPVRNRFIGISTASPMVGMNPFGVVTPKGQVHANQKPTPYGIPWTPNTNLKRRVSPIDRPHYATQTNATPAYAKPTAPDWLDTPDPRVSVKEIRLKKNLFGMQTPEHALFTGSGGSFGGGGGGAGGSGGGSLGTGHGNLK